MNKISYKEYRERLLTSSEEVFDGSFKSKIDSIPIKKKKWELIKESYQQVHHCTLGRTII